MAGILSKLRIMNRRKFLKSLIGACFYSVIPVSFSTYLQGRDIYPILLSHSYIPKERERHMRIFCQVENQKLETEIEKCAKEIGCEVLYGEPFSPDLVALGGFIYILDRNIVGELWWEEYVSMCDDYRWDEPCILVDTMTNLTVPRSNVVMQFDLTNNLSLYQILYIIKETRLKISQKNGSFWT